MPAIRVWPQIWVRKGWELEHQCDDNHWDGIVKQKKEESATGVSRQAFRLLSIPVVAPVLTRDALVRFCDPRRRLVLSFVGFFAPRHHQTRTMRLE